MKTTEAQTKALITIVYPRLVSDAKKSRAKVGKAHLRGIRRPRPDVVARLVDMGLIRGEWTRRMYGNEERDVRVWIVSAEAKRIARAAVRERLKANGVLKA